MQDLTTFLSNHPLLSSAILILLILLFIVEAIRAKRKSSGINPQQAVQLINHQNGVVIDVRPKELYQTGHIIDAVSIPAKELNDNPKKLEKYKNRPLIFVCNTGIESQKIAAQVQKQGYNVYSLASGLRAWTDAQLPLIKEK